MAQLSVALRAVWAARSESALPRPLGLDGDGPTKKLGTRTSPGIDDVDARLIKRLLAGAIQLNAENSDPSMGR